MAYIDREIFINNELIPLVKRLDLCHPKQKKGVLMAIQKLNEEPTADVQEVVRCKDCFHYTIINGTCLLLSCKEQTVRVYEDDYCSNGLNKRKVNYCTDKQNNLVHCEDCHEEC